MELELNRYERTPKSTIGELLINGEHQCYTLEDVDRGLMKTTSLGVIKRNKVYGKTAIPAGRYEVRITFSNRFQKLMPQIMDVPGFEGIRIHPGNTDADTEGCVLPGYTTGPDFIGNSRKAYEHIMYFLQKANEPIFITIH